MTEINNEDFLQYLWRTKQFKLNSLKTTEGKDLEILDFGILNHDSGPDFSHAKIKLDKTIWIGHIEVHIKSSHWIKHGHQNDKTYNNVILHVVFEEDQIIYLSDETRIPCLELRGRIPPKMYSRYIGLQGNGNWIPCENQFPELPELRMLSWLDRLCVERLDQKYVYAEHQFNELSKDWDQLFFLFLCRSLGTRVNKEAFVALAKSIDIKILSKYRNQLFQIEAILFGQAGLLNSNFKTEYPKKLYREYRFLARKHQLQHIPKSYWKFSRMRPANFPTIRIAQLASFISKNGSIINDLLYKEDFTEITEYFNMKVSEYWEQHYLFEDDSQYREKPIGQDTKDLIVINAVVPVLYALSKYYSDNNLLDKAIRWLSMVNPEKNTIIKKWKSLGLIPHSARDSQALIELKLKYCNQKRCLDCSIGHVILKINK